MEFITKAWDKHEAELRNFLISRVNDYCLAEDLLQDVFVKALSENKKFSHLHNPRAWLFRVARNRLIDYLRTQKNYDEVPENLPLEQIPIDTVTRLSKCLPVALKNLFIEDREIIEMCDLGNTTQSEYATLKKITTAGAKSRIQRARKRLRKELKQVCKIIFDEQGNVYCFDPTSCERDK